MKTNLYRRSIQIVSDYKGVEIQLYRRDENGMSLGCKRIKANKLSAYALVKLDHILQRSDCQRQCVMGTVLITNAFFGENVRVRQ